MYESLCIDTLVLLFFLSSSVESETLALILFIFSVIVIDIVG